MYVIGHSFFFGNSSEGACFQESNLARFLGCFPAMIDRDCGPGLMCKKTANCKFDVFLFESGEVFVLKFLD